MITTTSVSLYRDPDVTIFLFWTHPAPAAATEPSL